MGLSDDETALAGYLQEAVALLRDQNDVIATHPNSTLYESLGLFVDFGGYYLESNPCLVVSLLFAASY
jgi:hypothetical protein